MTEKAEVAEQFKTLSHERIGRRLYPEYGFQLVPVNLVQAHPLAELGDPLFRLRIGPIPSAVYQQFPVQFFGRILLGGIEEFDSSGIVLSHFFPTVLRSVFRTLCDEHGICREFVLFQQVGHLLVDGAQDILSCYFVSDGNGSGPARSWQISSVKGHDIVSVLPGVTVFKQLIDPVGKVGLAVGHLRCA